MTRVAVVHLGRARARGEEARIRSWRAILEAAGADVVTVPLLATARGAGDVIAVARGRVVPETLSWSPRAAAARLESANVDAVVIVTTRAYHPRIVSGRIAVLDLVDQLSRSYQDRACLTTGPRGVLLGWLAGRQERFERDVPTDMRLVAAGRADASALGAAWIPNVITTPILHPVNVSPDVDVLFFGTLSYPPNVGAVNRLAALWPEVMQRRPGTSALIAGATPPEAVRRTAHAHSWDLVAGFDDLAKLCARARLAVVPLRHAAGIQNKVIEAAAHGLAQVVSPAALDGLDDAMPVEVGHDDDSFVASMCNLLDDDGARMQLADDARKHVLAYYTAARWAEPVRALLRG